MTAATTVKAPPIPPAGTWNIDAVHSAVGFSVKHLMVSKVRGTFDTFSGTITVAEDGTPPAVQAEIDVTSINTNNEQRDGHIKSADFFDAEQFPTATFVSTGVRAKGDDYILDGDFTLKGVTKPVSLELEYNGTNRAWARASSPDSTQRPSSTARTSASTSRCPPSKVAASSSATRSPSPSRSRLSRPDLPHTPPDRTRHPP